MLSLDKSEKKNLLMDATGCDADVNSQLMDKFEDGVKEKIEKAVQDTLGLVR